MSPKQMNFLDNMTRAQAIRLMAKFNDDPYQAFKSSRNAAYAFMAAYELVNPTEYIQIFDMAGGPEFNYLCK